MAFLLAATLLVQDGSPMNGDQFMRFLETAHAEIHDFELTCEGETRLGAGARVVEQKGVDSVQYAHQANYAYRSDGATFLDIYEKPFDPRAPWLHKLYTQIDGKATELVESPDTRGTVAPPSISKGVPGAFPFTGSAERFIYLPYWRQLGYSARNIGFEFGAWEEIDGNQVLRVVIDPYPNSRHRDRLHLWLDMHRGAHVLKCESYRESKLRYRLHGVVLAALPAAAGKQIWLPVRAEFDSFVQGVPGRPPKVEYTTEPVFHETYRVVHGSVVLNRGLKDDRFTSIWRGKRPVSRGLESVSKEFSRTPQRPAPEPMRRDPAGVQELLEQRLAEADRQSVQLDASPGATGVLDVYALFPSGLAVLGAGILIGAIAMRRRSR